MRISQSSAYWATFLVLLQPATSSPTALAGREEAQGQLNLRNDLGSEPRFQARSSRDVSPTSHLLSGRKPPVMSIEYQSYTATGLSAGSRTLLTDKGKAKRALDIELTKRTALGVPIRPWPAGIIPFCYENKLAYDELHVQFDRVVKKIAERWRDHYPGTPFPIHFHAMTRGVPAAPRCPADTRGMLVVQFEQGTFAATTGYAPDYALYIILGGDIDTPDERIGHELFHIFSWSHEHQRPDAAQHIEYFYENLLDYPHMVQTHEKPHNPDGHPKGWVLNTVCRNYTLAQSLGFSAASIMPIDLPLGTEGSVMALGEFDHESISNYASFLHARDHSSNKPLMRSRKPVMINGQMTTLLPQINVQSRRDNLILYKIYVSRDLHLHS